MMNLNFSGKTLGILMLLGAALLISNQFRGFFNIGIGGIIIAVMALALFVQCIQNANFTSIPIPFALLYIVLQSPLGLYYIRPWTLIGAAALATVGLSFLFPQKSRKKSAKVINTKINYNPQYENNTVHSEASEINVEESDSNNNQSVNVIFGGASRYLHADSLEYLNLQCNFGGLEIYMDQVQLKPGGAEINVHCFCGGVEIYVPKHWHVIEKVHCTFGAVDVKKGLLSKQAEDSPVLTITGNVTCGALEVEYV